MHRSSGMGMDITPDVMNSFFKLQPTTSLVRRHHIGSSVGSKRASGTATPFSDVTDHIEQKFKLSDNYEESVSVVVPEVNEMLLPEPEDEIEPVRDEISVEVYDNYNFEHTYPKNLPITTRHEEVIQTIEANRVTVLQGSTGSGKTTQVPQYILDYYQQSGRYCNILVTQPRRIAAMSVAKRVSNERNWPLGTLVGFQVARMREITEDTRITYMTTGVLLQKLIKNKSLGDYTHVVLDEVHERDQDVDFGMLVVRKYLQSVSKNVKVILMSATVDSNLFARYFSTLINGEQALAPVLSIEGKMFQVSEYYFNDISTLNEPPQLSLYEPEVNPRCYELCLQIIMALDQEEVGDDYQDGMVADSRGTVLCFLPGRPEIQEMHRLLAKKDDLLKFKVLPLHSQITSAEQQRVFVRSATKERKVILSTNIAESSITVPDIKYVIDFCLTKQNETDIETNYQRLTLQWASQASLTQRKGRAGRVAKGYCFRLIPKRMFYDLPEYSTPEMLTAPLEQVVLKVKLLELGSPAQTLRLALQPPAITDIRKTILLLKEVGALTVRQNRTINPLDGDLTFVGRVLGSLPVDVHIGKLIMIGYTFGVLEECLVIGACLSIKSLFSRRFGMEFSSYVNKMHWSRHSGSDLLTSLRVFKEWKFKKLHTGFGMPEKRWAENNRLEGRRFREVDELVSELQSRLEQFNMKLSKDIFSTPHLEKDDEFILKLVIAGAFYPNYFQSQAIDEHEASKSLSGLNPFTTVVVNNAPPTLCHYITLLAALFRQCGSGKKIYFENTKAFIEFKRNEDEDGVVCSAVCKAIKMRHLRMPLDIHVSKKTDENLSRNIRSEYKNPETGLRTNRVNSGVIKNNENKGRLFVTMDENTKQVKLKPNGYINLIIQEIVGVGHFWATYADEEPFCALHQLHTKINELGGRNLPLMDNPELGSYCLAPFEDEFFRAEILSISHELIKVFFLDYGNTTTITEKNHIRKCPDHLLQLPFQAFECYLSEIRPAFGNWTDESLLRFAEIAPIGTKKLIGKVYCIMHGAYRLELFNDDMSVNRMLIEEKHAAYKEESIASQKRHEQSLRGEQQREEGGHEMVVQDIAQKVNPNAKEVLKISLRGPHSPYEMSFYGLNASSKLRCCRVENDSVNSVLICEEAEDSRLLIAATVNINSSGNNIVARETSLLPNIPGLKSIVPLLFAPVAEFRCDKKCSQYTGALCGLGCDDAGAAILPDHDIEVSFGVKFDKHDLLLINSVRFVINTVIGMKEEHITFTPEQINGLQVHAREKVKSLTNRTREEMTPVVYRKEYFWKQLSEKILLDDCGYEEEPTHLYVYHRGIFLYNRSTVDPRIQQQRDELEQLHKLAGRSTTAFTNEVVCPVCYVACRHPRALYLHIETPQHQNWVNNIFKDS